MGRRMILWSLSLLWLLISVQPVFANRLFTSGFEENAFTTTLWTAQAITTIVTTSPRSGTYAMENATQGDQGYARKNLSTQVTSGTLYTRVCFYFITSLPTSTRGLIWVESVGGADNWALTVVSPGVLHLVNNVTTTDVAGPTLTANTWYCAEVRHLVADTGGQIEGRVDGGSAWGIGAFTGGNGTNEDTLATDVTQFTFGGAGPAGGSPVARWDDIAINDANGTFQNSWPGLGKIAMLVPNTEVSIGWTPSTGTDNSANVDDLPGTPDDDTTYNSSATANTEDRLGLTALGAEVPSNAVIVLADVWARIRGEGTTASRQCRVLLWDDAGAQTNGPTTALNDSTTYQVMSTADHLVFDASGETKTSIDSYDVGAEPLTAHATRLTALWVNVEWREAAAGTALKPWLLEEE